MAWSTVLAVIVTGVSCYLAVLYAVREPYFVCPASSLSPIAVSETTWWTASTLTFRFVVAELNPLVVFP